MREPIPGMMPTRQQFASGKMDPGLRREGLNARSGKNRQIGYAPDTKRFVCVGSACFGALLVQDRVGGRKPEGRGLQIQKSPVAVHRISVLVMLRKRRGNEPAEIASSDIGESLADIRERQVHETITAEDRICCRKRIAEEIELTKFYPAIGGSKQCGIALDNLTDDVGPDISIELQVKAVHPSEVAARQIQERPYANSFEQSR